MLKVADPAVAVAFEDVYVFETVTESVRAVPDAVASNPVAVADCVTVNFAAIVLPVAATPVTKFEVKLRNCDPAGAEVTRTLIENVSLARPFGNVTVTGVVFTTPT